MHLSLGKVYATPEALHVIEEAGHEVVEFVVKHNSCDWGDVCEEDRKLNDLAVQNGDRVLSAYTLRNGARVWVITEADRSYTTVLLPHQY